MKYTRSAGGIVLNRDRVLVVNQNHNSWSLPKGHIDQGETPLQAAKREIYEESGIKYLKLIRDLGRYSRYKIALTGGDDRSERKTIYMFLFLTDQAELCPIDPSNPEARWVTKDQVEDLLTHYKDKEFYRKARTQL